MNGMTNEFNLFEGITEERVRALEQRVELQEEEISVLKSALADVLRRLKELETSSYASPRRPSPMKNHFQPLPSKPIVDHVSQSKPRARPPSPSIRGRLTPNRDLGGQNGRGDVRKSSSSDQINRNGKRSSSRSRKPSGTYKAPTYNDDDASVRMHLRGRPVVLYKPTSFESYNPSDQSHLPDHKLKLEWVYGYRGKDCRSNLYFLPTGEIVYFVAAVVVLYDPKDGYQRHYLGHNDDVKCLAIHSSKLKIATGQMAGLEMDGRPRVPQVHIWDAVTLNTLHIISSFDRSVASVSFSKIDGGALLCAVDESNDHVLTVWDWAKETKIAEAKSSKDQVLACEFNPYIDGAIVTCGKSHINFWALESGQLTRKQGLFEELNSMLSNKGRKVEIGVPQKKFNKHEKPKYLLCLGFTSSGEVLSGDSNGNVQVWSKGPTRKITHIIEKAHEGPVFSIFATRDFFITGGKDGRLMKYSEDFSTSQQTEVSFQIPSDAGSVRTVTCNDQGMMLVGTKSNRILYGGFEKQFDTIVHGHTEELWGLAVHPTQPHFLTGSHDKQLIMWNGYNHSPMWIKTFDDGIQSADFHPVNENLVAVGMTTGRWVVMDSVNQELVTVHTDGSEQHDVIKFSPDGTCLAIGSHDNNIYIYSVGESGRKYSRIGRCSGHSSYITHLDWSKDSQYIQSNSGDYELLYWDVTSCKQVPTPSSFRDVEWHTQTCTLGFSVLGIWPEGADGTDVNSVGRSNNGKLLASGDDFGKIHLFKYPAVQPRSVNHEYRGHSSHVTSVKFLSNNEKLLSTGGQDCSTMQWKVV